MTMFIVVRASDEPTEIFRVEAETAVAAIVRKVLPTKSFSDGSDGDEERVSVAVQIVTDAEIVSERKAIWVDDFDNSEWLAEAI